MRKLCTTDDGNFHSSYAEIARQGRDHLWIAVSSFVSVEANNTFMADSQHLQNLSAQGPSQDKKKYDVGVYWMATSFTMTTCSTSIWARASRPTLRYRR